MKTVWSHCVLRYMSNLKSSVKSSSKDAYTSAQLVKLLDQRRLLLGRHVLSSRTTPVCSYAVPGGQGALIAECD